MIFPKNIISCLLSVVALLGLSGCGIHLNGIGFPTTVANTTTSSVSCYQNQTSYKGIVLCDAPQFYYRMDDTAGNIADSSGSGYAGIEGGAETLTYGVSGILSGDAGIQWGGAGLGGYQINHSVPVTAITMEAWVKPSTTQTAYPSVLWTDDSPSSTNQGIFLAAHSNFFYVQAGNGTTQAGVNGSPVVQSFTPGSFYHLVVTFDGNNLKYYQNGSLVTQSALAGPLMTSSGIFTIGWDQVYGNQWTGSTVIDEVAIYNYALGASQIQTHYPHSQIELS